PDGCHGDRIPGREVAMVVEGQNSAQPRPPSVNVSSTAWLPTARPASHAVCHAFCPASLAASPTSSAMATANANECVAPRCPHASAYWMPNANPATSASGSNDSADHPTIDARYATPLCAPG